MRKIIGVILLTLTCFAGFAQTPAAGGNRGGGRGMGGQNMSIGHFYGKIVDSKTNKGIPGVTVQLIGNKFDTATKQLKQNVVLKTIISENNGDFSLDGLPVFGNFKLHLSAVGFKTIDKPVSFNIKMPQQGSTTTGGLQEGNGGQGNAMQQLLGQTDKDLGNIKMDVDATDLGNVTVTSSAKPLFELGIDKKVFNVDKNLVSTGQTATEIMKSIPSLNVDIDGNVTLRNASPTIFVDGRPTTMTLDQIPSDIIDKVEIITNPSAKYDASGGNAGILNIVLKKNKKNGYNGGIRAGVDSRGKINGGADLNYRQGKLNFTMSGMYNQRKSIYETNTDQAQYGGSQGTISTIADEKGNNTGAFGFGRLGVDYFVDNRNTFSLTGNYNKGKFTGNSDQYVDTTIANAPYSSTYRHTNTVANFNNFGGQLSFKHNFAQNGHDITADVNYNSSTTSSNSLINNNVYYKSPIDTTLYQQQAIGSGYNHYFTLQSDYENQLTDDSKFEAGIRGAIRDFETLNLQYIANPATGQQLQPNAAASSYYKYKDQVYAAYSTYSFKIKKWSYQLGLRVESSSYTGHLMPTPFGGKDTTFKVNYPLSLFPSVFITYKIDSKQDFQVNYSRRVNRPNFFQLLPSYDFTNPTSPQVGNPNLKPEFTSSFEMSYNYNYMKGSNFLATVFFKYTTDLITRYLYKDIDRNNLSAHPTDSLYYTTYINANNSYSYGLELTDKQQVSKWWDLTLNVNFYNSVINATIPGQDISNSQLSWFGKMNNNFKIAKGWSVQFSGDYTSKTLIPQNSGGGQGGGGRGGGMFGSQQALAQGYILPRYGFDAAIRKDWTWKNGQSGSITLSMNDIFRTQLYKTTATSQIGSETIIQDIQRRRDPQVLRLNFNYRFGKFDAALFKRKNTKLDQGGSDMMGGNG
ncbi:TonB-dependent receptor domain-containing protein [Chitinophagaceae bacterium LWZ2-11]